ncbi:hypothetical protein GCM10011320_38890 [Neoroseomonas lacus]|uniref:Uncharacterized protein n=1 Tax=Neoroseomonas lacus TaxID=287609 RepID=A0A917KW67_9PROT|nr:hypothetical protein GCM10011320_38890 [Neoroseomonas lacus]
MTATTATIAKRMSGRLMRAGGSGCIGGLASLFRAASDVRGGLVGVKRGDPLAGPPPARHAAIRHAAEPFR